MLVPVRASPVPSVVRGSTWSFVVKFFLSFIAKANTAGETGAHWRERNSKHGGDFVSGQAASILQCMWLFLTLFGLLGGAAVCSLGSWEERLFGSLTDIEPVEALCFATNIHGLQSEHPSLWFIMGSTQV